MDFAKIWKVTRTVLGKLTDLLLIGRNSGWWSKRTGLDLGNDSRGLPHKPGK